MECIHVDYESRRTHESAFFFIMCKGVINVGLKPTDWIALKDGDSNLDEFRITEDGVDISQVGLDGIQVITLTYDQFYQIERTLQKQETPF